MRWLWLDTLTTQWRCIADLIGWNVVSQAALLVSALIKWISEAEDAHPVIRVILLIKMHYRLQSAWSQCIGWSVCCVAVFWTYGGRRRRDSASTVSYSDRAKETRDRCYVLSNSIAQSPKWAREFMTGWLDQLILTPHPIPPLPRGWTWVSLAAAIRCWCAVALLLCCWATIDLTPLLQSYCEADRQSLQQPCPAGSVAVGSGNYVRPIGFFLPPSLVFRNEQATGPGPEWDGRSSVRWAVGRYSCIPDITNGRVWSVECCGASCW